MYNIKNPIAFHSVDIAITRIHNYRKQILLAQKVKDTEGGSNIWRLPGGFLDPWDSCAEESALRESIEETAMKFGDLYFGEISLATANEFEEYFSKKKPLTKRLSELIKSNTDTEEVGSIIEELEAIVISETCSTWLRKNVHYIGSARIDDARYRDTHHKIITSLYEIQNPVGVAGEGPFDDIARTKWFYVSEIKEEIMHPAHKPLFKMLFANGNI